MTPGMVQLLKLIKSEFLNAQSKVDPHKTYEFDDVWKVMTAYSQILGSICQMPSKTYTADQMIKMAIKYNEILEILFPDEPEIETVQ